MAPTKTSQHWTCCGLRRRSITNKLTALFIQVIVVVAVWHVVRRYDRNVVCLEDTKSESARSVQGEAVPLCKPGEYTKGTHLSLNDIVVSSSSHGEKDSFSEEQRSKNVLDVDIFVRDADSDKLVMYPKGTPFEMDDSISSKGESVDMSDFYYDNSVEERDLDKIVNDKTRIQHDEESKDKNPILPSNQNDTNNILNTPQTGQNEVNSATDQIVSNQRDSRQFPTQPAVSMQGQGSNFAQPQNQIAPPNVHNFAIEHSQQAHDYNLVEAPQTTRVYEDFTITESRNLADSSEEALYTNGFKERVNIFKSEFYGKSIENLAHPSDTQYLMNNANACQHLEYVDLLFLIHTVPQSEEQRQRIRTTFVQKDLFKPFNVVYVFLVGKTTSPNFQTNLNKDSETYNDIVQGDFMDKPDTRTHKGLMGMKWTLSFCPNAKHVLKIDQDVFVDTGKLLKGLIPTMNKVVGERAMLCFFNPDAPIPRSGPNAVSPDLFPNSSKLRPYCKGFAVLMTPATVKSLVAASEHVPICPLEDMFLYGILPFIAGSIEVYDLGNKRAFHDFGMAVVTCYQELQDKCPFVLTKAYSARFTSLWEMVKARMESRSETSFLEQPMWDLGSWRRQLSS